jgi:ferredoxin
MPEPYPTAGHPDDIDIAEAEAFGREMVDRSQKIHAGATELIPPVPKAPEPGLEGFKQGIVEVEKKLGFPEILSNELQFRKLLKFDKNKCTYPECRLCMDNCPMDGIDLSVDPPVIAKPCLDCTFCAKVCPTGALDESRWVETFVERNRALMKSFYMAGLVEPEKEGRFRRLVPIDEVGYDTPVSKLHDTHPQWVIGEGLQ